MKTRIWTILIAFMLLGLISIIPHGYSELTRGRVLTGTTVGTNFELDEWTYADAFVKNYYSRTLDYENNGIIFSSGKATRITGGTATIIEEDNNNFLRYNHLYSGFPESVDSLSPMGDEELIDIQSTGDLGDPTIIDNLGERALVSTWLSPGQAGAQSVGIFNPADIDIVTDSSGWGSKVARVTEGDQSYSRSTEPPYGATSVWLADRDYDIFEISVALPTHNIATAIQSMLQNRYYALGLYVESDGGDIEWDIEIGLVKRTCLVSGTWDDNSCQFGDSNILPTGGQGLVLHTMERSFNDGEKTYLSLDKTMLEIISSDLSRGDFSVPNQEDDFVALQVRLHSDDQKIGSGEKIKFDWVWLTSSEPYHTVEASLRLPLETGFPYDVNLCIDPMYYPSDAGSAGLNYTANRYRGYCNGIRISNAGSYAVTGDDNTATELFTGNMLGDGEWHKVIASFKFISLSTLNYTAYVNGTIYTGELTVTPLMVGGDINGVYIQLYAESNPGLDTKSIDIDDLYFYEEEYSSSLLAQVVNTRETTEFIMSMVPVFVVILVIGIVAHAIFSRREF